MATLSAEDLRTIPSLTGTAPRLELDDLPRDPTDLFAEWLRVALEHGVPEPVAATLATVDDDGVPDARTLILKAVDARGWAFAGSATSRKGQQLTARNSRTAAIPPALGHLRRTGGSGASSRPASSSGRDRRTGATCASSTPTTGRGTSAREPCAATDDGPGASS